MMQNVTRPFLNWMLAGALLLGLVACSPAEKKSGPSPEEQARQQAQLVQRLSAVQEQAARLQKQVADMRVEQDQRLRLLTADSQALIGQVSELARQLGVTTTTTPTAVQPGAGVAVAPVTAPEARPAAAPVAQPAPAESSPLVFLLRLVLVLIIIAAIWIVVKIFMGRWGEEDTEEDDFGPDVADEMPARSPVQPKEEASEVKPADGEVPTMGETKPEPGQDEPKA